jgi:hypothetical protein
MNSFVPLSREELIKEIKFINSKPKEFSAEQKAEKSNLESLLISLKEQ